MTFSRETPLTMQRYAVLHDLNDADKRPVALLVESRDRIRLYPVPGYTGETVFDGDYMTIEPHGGFVTYSPGNPKYWDYVLLMLSREYMVGEVDQLQQIDRPAVLELFYDKIAEARITRRAPYVVTSVTAPVFVSFASGEAYSTARAPDARRANPQPPPAHHHRPVERHHAGGVPVGA